MKPVVVRSVIAAAVLILSPASVFADSANRLVYRTTSPSPLRAAMADTAWMASAAVLDVGATRYALNRCPGCYEANPLMQTTGKALATKALATAASGFICYELRKHGHAREAKWFRWGIVGLWSGLAVNAAIRAR